MSKYKKSPIGTKEVNSKLVEYLNDIETCINGTILVINHKKNPEKQWAIIIPLIHAIGDSCNSIKILIESGLDPEKMLIPKTRDTIIIARSIIETSLNIIFILAKGEEAAIKARKHYIQKSYRNLDRELKILDQVTKLKWSGEVDLEKNTDLRESLDEFTKENGQVIYEWTQESNKKKLEFIHKKFGPNVSGGIQIPYFFTYPMASELIHGTFFGAMALVGLSEIKERPESVEELENYSRSWITSTLTMILLSLDSLMEAIALELPNKEIKNIFRETVDSYFKEEWIKEIRK